MLGHPVFQRTAVSRMTRTPAPYSQINNSAAKACPNPNAAAAPAIPQTGKNAYAKTMLAGDVVATIANRGRTRLDTRKRVMKTLFARTRGLASARITRDSYPAPEYAGPK